LRKFHSFLFLAVVLSLAFTLTACHHKHNQPNIEPTPTPAPMPSENPPPNPGTIQDTNEGTEKTLDEITRMMQPVYFNFDRSEITDDQVPALQNNASVLKSNPDANALIEGHCDERGTNEYNLALGDRRAKAAKDYLVSLGIAESRISTISYGEDRPFKEGHNEDAWHENRRAHFVAIKK
jgi:peptidoglycan-associated lipoprotein